MPRLDQHPAPWAFAAVVATTIVGCSNNDTLPTSAPTTIERVADEGFQNAGAVAVSPDGETFYVLAYDPAGAPTVFSLDVASGDLESLHGGAPILYPSDVATSCDGDTLFVTDMGSSAGEFEIGASELDDTSAKPGGIYTMSTSGGEPSKLEAEGISRAAGVSVSHDCKSLYVSGWTDEGVPAAFRLPVGGGMVQVLHEGAPFVTPGGIHVDSDDVPWMMDFAARGEEGEGTLFAIANDGSVSEALTGVTMGRAGACSLVPGGVTAIVPATDGEGKAFLISANTVTGDKEILDQPDLQAPTGVAAARNAPVMAIATETAIYTATYE